MTWRRSGVIGDSELRLAIAEAAHAVDQTLGDDPFEANESREGEDRVIFASPSGVPFEVDLDAPIVRIEHLWRIRPPRRRT